LAKGRLVKFPQNSDRGRGSGENVCYGCRNSYVMLEALFLIDTLVVLKNFAATSVVYLCVRVRLVPLKIAQLLLYYLWVFITGSERLQG